MRKNDVVDRTVTVALLICECGSIVSGRVISRRSQELVDDNTELLKHNANILSMEKGVPPDTALNEDEMLGSGENPKEERKVHPDDDSESLKEALSTDELIEISKTLTDPSQEQRTVITDYQDNNIVVQQSPFNDAVGDISQPEVAPVNFLQDMVDLNNLKDLVDAPNDLPESFDYANAQNSSNEWSDEEDWESSGNLPDSLEQLSTLDDPADHVEKLSGFIVTDYEPNKSANDQTNVSTTAGISNQVSNPVDLSHILSDVKNPSSKETAKTTQAGNQLEQIPTSEYPANNQDELVMSAEDANAKPTGLLDLDDYFDKIEQLTSRVQNDTTEPVTVPPSIVQPIEPIRADETITERTYIDTKTTLEHAVVDELTTDTLPTTLERVLVNEFTTERSTQQNTKTTLKPGRIGEVETTSNRLPGGANTEKVQQVAKTTSKSVRIGDDRFIIERMHQATKTTSKVFCFYCAGAGCKNIMANDERNLCWSLSGSCWATYDIGSSTMTRGCNATAKYGVCTLPGGRRANHRCEWCCKGRKCNNGAFDERACQLISADNRSAITGGSVWLYFSLTVLFLTW